MDMRLNVAVAAAGGHLLRETLDQVEPVESKLVELPNCWQTVDTVELIELVDVSRVVLESFGELVGRPFCHSPTERQAFYLVVHRVSLMGSRASSRVDNRTQVLFFPFPSEFWSWHKVSKTKHVRTCEEYMWANNDARDSAGCVKLEGLVKDRMYLQTVLQIIWEFWDHLGSFGIMARTNC